MRPFPHSPPLNPSPPSSLQARVRLLTLVPAPAVSRVHLVRLASSYQFRIPKAARGWAGQLFHPSIPPSCLLPSRLNDPSSTLPAAKQESYFPLIVSLSEYGEVAFSPAICPPCSICLLDGHEGGRGIDFGRHSQCSTWELRWISPSLPASTGADRRCSDPHSNVCSLSSLHTDKPYVFLVRVHLTVRRRISTTSHAHKMLDPS